MLTPTNPFRRDPAGLFKTARFAWKLRNYEKEIYTLMQTLSLSAFDYVSRWFESDIVKAKFMFWATIGGNVGPYSPGPMASGWPTARKSRPASWCPT